MELTVQTAKPYSILLERGLLAQTGKHCLPLFPAGTRAMVISDSNVFPLYGETVMDSLRQAGYEACSCVFPAGEQSKLLSTVETFYRALGENGFTRSDFIVALGGGVTGDMAGFAAATFLRGISFIQVPTTLLAQVDSSVGGKTGVDTPFGKNLVGAFHQPRLVLIDPDTLSTLPEHFFRDGMGEVIKYGCIMSPSLFEQVCTGHAKDELESILYQCIDCKRQVVEQDTRDTGNRMILNFGHTLGHALEKIHGFEAGSLSHGMAVGIGMVLAAKAGEENGITQPGTASRIEKALLSYGMPISDPPPLADVLAATAMDKKSAGDSLRLILLKDIGESLIYPVKKAELPSFFGLAKETEGTGC